MRDPRLEKLADVLVNYSTAVKPGQIVKLNSPPGGLPLLTEIFRKVVAAGGTPIIRLNPEEFMEIFVKTASDDQLQYLNPIAVFEYEKIDVHIGLWAEENTKSLSNCDPKRMSIMERARKPLMEVFMKRAA